jgi:phosphohistidine phosphatase SixA
MLFKLIFIRHEKPYYKDEGHDLTPEGVEKSIELGKLLVTNNVIDNTAKILLLHSPKARTRGTLEFIKIGAGLDLPMEEVHHLRPSDFNDLNAFLGRKNDFGFSTEQLAKQ